MDANILSPGLVDLHDPSQARRMTLDPLLLEACPIGHLPLIRAVIDDLGIVPVLEERSPKHPRSVMSDADCVVLMILNVLSGRVALHRMNDWLDRSDARDPAGHSAARVGVPRHAAGSLPEPHRRGRHRPAAGRCRGSLPAALGPAEALVRAPGHHVGLDVWGLRRGGRARSDPWLLQGSPSRSAPAHLRADPARRRRDPSAGDHAGRQHRGRRGQPPARRRPRRAPARPQPGHADRRLQAGGRRDGRPGAGRGDALRLASARHLRAAAPGHRGHLGGRPGHRDLAARVGAPRQDQGRSARTVARLVR